MAAAPPTIAKRWDTIGTVPPIETCLMIARTRFGSARHRGRIQVQGQDVDGDPSFPWARQDPITRAEAIDGLHQLRDACSNVQLRNRREAFRKAERFIQPAACQKRSSLPNVQEPKSAERPGRQGGHRSREGNGVRMTPEVAAILRRIEVGSGSRIESKSAQWASKRLLEREHHRSSLDLVGKVFVS